MYLWRGSPAFATVAYWNIAGGVVGGLLAAVFGAIDWFTIPAGTRAKRIGLLHGGSNVVVVPGMTPFRTPYVDYDVLAKWDTRDVLVFRERPQVD